MSVFLVNTFLNNQQHKNTVDTHLAYIKLQLPQDVEERTPKYTD